MFDDTQIRLAAFTEARTLNPASVDLVLADATRIYAFLKAGYTVEDRSPEPATVALNPQPLAEPIPLNPEPSEATKRTRRTKAQMEADAAAAAFKNAAPVVDAVSAATASTAAGPAQAAEPAEPIDAVTMKAKLMEVVQKDGLGPLVAGGIVKKQGAASRVSLIPEANYAVVFAACVEALAGAAK